jgi:hypothetical protein
MMLPSRETLEIMREFQICTFLELSANLSALVLLIGLCSLFFLPIITTLPLIMFSGISYWYFYKKLTDKLNAI